MAETESNLQGDLSVDLLAASQLYRTCGVGFALQNYPQSSVLLNVTTVKSKSLYGK
ncbi:hypothetical protein [Citrobacter amalonaticus]|uniref:hypothetical protein n=1 Tax=Citrobacter amalonaticus TaxID=35703 RepID=UPI00339CF2BC